MDKQTRESKEKAKRRAELLMAKARSCNSDDVREIEEARTAAMLAVKLIEEHGLVLALPIGGKREPVREKAGAPSTPAGTWEGVGGDKWSKSNGEPAPPPWFGIRSRYVPKQGEGKWLRSHYVSNCRSCAGVIDYDDWVLWGGPGRGVLCERCVWKKVEAEA